jgi:hypothetical protein
MASLLPTTQDIAATVADQLALVGGVVSDRFDDTRRLYLRGILPMQKEVRPADVVEGGVAVMTCKERIEVHPYLYRQVCRNGAVMPQLGKRRCIERVPLSASSEAIDEVLDELREAVSSSSVPAVFSRGVGQFASAIHAMADFAILSLLLQSSVPRTRHRQLYAEIEERFLTNDDHSMFGLINAVTSVARDERDPELRWRLEELGGGVAATRLPRVKPGGAAAKRRSRKSRSSKDLSDVPRRAEVTANT